MCNICFSSSVLGTRIEDINETNYQQRALYGYESFESTVRFISNIEKDYFRRKIIGQIIEAFAVFPNNTAMYNEAKQCK